MNGCDRGNPARSPPAPGFQFAEPCFSHADALEGKVLKAGGVITDGPFVEIREMLGSFMIVKADSLEEAATLAHGCPAFDYNGSVEIRAIHG